MGNFNGDENTLGMFYESGNYANPTGTTLTWIGQVQNHTPNEDMGTKPTRNLGTNNRAVDMFVDGPQDVNGTFTYYPQDWKMLAFAFGTNVDAGSPSPYSHTMSETRSSAGNAMTSGNVFPSFTLEDSKYYNPTGLNFIRTIKGCIINNYSLNATQGGIVECNVDYIGQSCTYTSGAVSAITAATTRPFLWSDILLSIPSGTGIAPLKNITFSMANNTYAPHYLNGSRVIGTPQQLNLDYSLNATLDMTSELAKTFYDSYFQGGSTFNALLTLVDTAYGGIGSRGLIVTMSGCKLMDIDIPSPMEGVNEYTLTIQPQNCSALVNDDIFKYNAW